MDLDDVVLLMDAIYLPMLGRDREAPNHKEAVTACKSHKRVELSNEKPRWKGTVAWRSKEAAKDLEENRYKKWGMTMAPSSVG